MNFSISQYLEFRGDLKFKNDSFADTDAIILCQIGYVHFDSILEKSADDLDKLDFENRQPFWKLREKILTSDRKYEYMDVGLMNKKIPELFLQAAETERFKNVEICGFINKTTFKKDPKTPEQFAAMTCILDENTVCVVFRGTDDSIKGWKEDCNLATNEAIPSQIDALEYLSRAVEKFSGREIIVAGHSKGGNIAMYACAHLGGEKKPEIAAIYNLDGPGFSKETLDSAEMTSIKPILHSWYPEQSIVGMLFHHYPENYKIAKSSAPLILQHDLSSWLVHGKFPATAENFSSVSVYMNKSFNEWYENLPGDEKRKQFIDSLFSILEHSSKETLSAMIGDIQTEIYSAAAEMKSTDKTFVRKTVDAATNISKIIAEGGMSGIKSGIAMTKGTIEVMRDPEQRQILKEIGEQLMKAGVSSARELALEKKYEEEKEAERNAKTFKESVMANIADAKDIGMSLINGILGK